MYQHAVGDSDLATGFYCGRSSGESEIAGDEEGDYDMSSDFGIFFEMEKDWLSLRFGYHRSPDVDVDSNKRYLSYLDKNNVDHTVRWVIELKP